MWPFNRNKKQQNSAVANEIQDYYQTERRERKGMAWLLAIATFLVTLFFVLAVFYGGKWIYRKVKNDEPKVAETTQEQPSDKSSQSTDQNSQPNEAQNNQNQSSDSSSSSSGSGASGTQSSPQTSSTSTSTPSPAPATTPVTGPASEELPRTGPDQDL